MSARITATTAAREFSDLLNRVRYRGERFVIERGGEPVADLVPHEVAPAVFTVADFVALVKSLPPLDDDWGRDLQHIHAHQGVLPGDPWESS
jgi:prevent-host-death family protein